MENGLGCSFCGLKIEPDVIDFQVEEGWIYVPGKQTMRVKRTGSGELFPRWNTTVDADWVELSPSHSDIEETIVVSIRSTAVGKPVGVYLATVTFNSQQATNTPVYATVRLTVKAKPKPLVIITGILPGGMTDIAYECSIEAEGGIPPFEWTCEGLPEGLVFDAQNAKIGGTPMISGDFPITVKVKDSKDNLASADYTISIAERPVNVAITSPVGGEIWYKNETHEINWVTDDAMDDFLDIDLICDGVEYSVAIGVSILSLRYSWQIGGVPVSENAIVRLTTFTSSAQSGIFSIREHSGCWLGPLWEIIKHFFQA
jgi:hypothetical protein